MKEELENIIQSIKRQHPLHIATMVISALSFVAAGIFIFSLTNKTEAGKTVTEKPVEQTNLLDLASLVAVVGENNSLSDKNISSNNSWPGEIISSEISQIQPQREGVIKSWRVNIGDSVSQGEVLGEISAPPATPELVAMLAEKNEGLTRAKAQAILADEFAEKEQLRFDALKNSIGGKKGSSAKLSLPALESLRKLAEGKIAATRSFVERAISRHVTTLSDVRDWRYFLSAGNLNKQYGNLNQSIQNDFGVALSTLIGKLKSSEELPLEDAKKYFALAVQLANNSTDNLDMSISGFKMTAADDQNEFLGMLTEYWETQAELADKEAEYKIMLSENSAMVERDRSMSHAEVDAMEASYRTVAREITSGLSIIAPRAGTVSAIYRQVGDLVDPGMSIAVIAGHDEGDFIVRINIPNNIRKPAIGETLSVVRPGFPMDKRQAKITGVGSSLDEMGSYMADAVFIDPVDWPAGSSVRIIAPENSDAPIIKLSSVWWGEDGTPNVWKISEEGKIVAQKIIIGRTFGTAEGTSVEIYEGMKNGDRYVIEPTPDIHEGMLLEKITTEESAPDEPMKSDEHDAHKGMEM